MRRDRSAPVRAAWPGSCGLGPKALRALVLTAELIFGVKASARDPARFSFAHGGKDGTPYPFDRGTYDQTIEVLRNALGWAKSVDRSERIQAGGQAPRCLRARAARA